MKKIILILILFVGHATPMPALRSDGATSRSAGTAGKSVNIIKDVAAPAKPDDDCICKYISKIFE